MIYSLVTTKENGTNVKIKSSKGFSSMQFFHSCLMLKGGTEGTGRSNNSLKKGFDDEEDIIGGQREKP